MTSIAFNDQDALNQLVSEEFGAWSNSFLVDQKLINDFADLSGDHQWIHVDEERAKAEGPFGSTIAHGFLVLACMSRFEHGESILDKISGFKFMTNYGSNKLRFLDPVPVNSEVHSRNRVKSVEVSDRGTKITMEQNVHVVGNERPSLIYELILMMF
ncbi:MAG: MaoC family dehydratase [Pseudomonadales bacterium]